MYGTHLVRREVHDHGKLVGHRMAPVHCPYGQPGDRLWVRETWRVGAWNEEDGQIAVDYRADNHARKEWLEVTADDEGETFNRLWEQSCHDASAAGRALNAEDRYKWKAGESPCRWRPSIFMPRWASRITLEVTDVRVGRVQEITEHDAKAEGLLVAEGSGLGSGPGYKWHGAGYHGAGFTDRGEPTFHTPTDDGRCSCKVAGPTPAQCAYRELWDSLNAKRAPWASDPWVWVVSFRRLP